MSHLAEKNIFMNGMRVISMRDLLETVLMNVRLLAIFLIVSFVFGVFFAYFRAPLYQSHALLEVSRSNSGSNTLFSQFASMSGIGTSGQVASEQYILNSRGVLANAIATYHLDIVVTPWRFPILGSALANHYDQNPTRIASGPARPLFGLSRYDWGGDSVTVNQFIVPERWKNDALTLHYLGADQYQLLHRKKIILTGVVGQLITAQRGSDVITLFISKINAYPNTYFTIKKLPMLEAINRLKSKISVNQAADQTNLLSLVAKGRPHEHLKSLLGSIINNAVTLSVQVRSQKAENVLEFVDQQLPAIHHQLDKMDNKMRQQFPMGPAYENLEREKNIQDTVYTKMLQEVAQYGLKRASSLGDITIITPPTDIFLVKRIPNAVLAILITVLGLLIGVGLLFARNFMMGVVLDSQQIEQITGLSLLAGLHLVNMQAQQVTLFKKQRIKHLKCLAELDENDPVLEGFRSLRTSLFLNYFSRGMASGENNIITVSGPTPSIGKSFVSVNLAQQFAETGKRILLVDADLRKGTIRNYFEISSGQPGFVDLIKGKGDAKPYILKTRFECLDVLPSGELHSRNSELLLQENIQQILFALAKQYDYLIIDTAPILLVNDALSICRHAAVNLLTFAYGKHSEREIDLTIKRFEKSKVRLHGFIMNLIPTPKLGYGYGYGYGYGNDAKTSKKYAVSDAQ